MRTAVFAALVSLSLGACSTINVMPEDYLAPPQTAYERMPAKVALVVPAQFASYHHVGSPDSLSGSMRTFDFDLGRPMAESLRAHLGAAFTLVPEGQPADVIITPTFESFRFSLDDDNQAAKGALIGVLSMATTQPAAVTDLEMRLDLIDAWGKPAASVRTKGHGVSRGTAMGFNMERSMTISASAAISQASSKAVYLLINDPAFQVAAAGRR